MHEHSVITSPGVTEAYPQLSDRKARSDALVRGFLAAKAAGIDTIVDCTTPDLGRDVYQVLEASAISGLQVVLCTGIWLDVPRWFQVRDADAAAAMFIGELEHGIAETGVQAGIIKVASHEEVTPAQEIILRGAARAALATGAAITTHTLATARTGLRQVEILQEEAVPPERVIIGHNCSTDREYLAALYGAGVYVGWDQFALPSEIGPEDLIIAVLAEFLAQGHANRTLISGDFSPFVDWDMAEALGYRHVPDVVLPKLRAHGVDDETIRLIMVDSPARLLDRGAPIRRSQ
jgi:phosphotriesterase-related protein